MPTIAPPIYDNEVNELSVFPNLKMAKNWLKNNKLDTSGTPILVPFKDENKKIFFLKPSNSNIFSDPMNEKITHEANKDIRIIGAGNSSHVHGFFGNIQAALTAKRVPHLNELEGEILSLVDHGFIIIYKRGKTKVGHQFAELFEKEKQSLLEEIKTAQVNEEPPINPAKFLEEISSLALELDIKTGMTYFVTTDKSDNQHVYRHTFKQDPDNISLEEYLKEEAKWHESKRVKVQAHKSQNHHIIRFLIDWCKWTAFAVITAIVAGLIVGIFITPPLGAIAAAVVAIVTFVGISSIGFVKADKNNPTTVEFGTPEFEIESEDTFFSRIKKRVSSLKDFFCSKSNKTIALSTENINSEMSTTRSEFSTIIDIATESNLNQSCATLIKSSLQLSLLFKFSQKNNFSTTGNNLLNTFTPSLRN